MLIPLLVMISMMLFVLQNFYYGHNRTKDQFSTAFPSLFLPGSVCNIWSWIQRHMLWSCRVMQPLP